MDKLKPNRPYLARGLACMPNRNTHPSRRIPRMQQPLLHARGAHGDAIASGRAEQPPAKVIVRRARIDGLTEAGVPQHPLRLVLVHPGSTPLMQQVGWPSQGSKPLEDADPPPLPPDDEPLLDDEEALPELEPPVAAAA